MSNLFAIYSGSTNDSVPNKFYLKGQKYKYFIGYAKTLKEAKKMFEKENLGESKWAQIVCLTTFNIIESQISIDINKPLYEGYYSSDDEYDKRKKYYNKK